MILLLDYFAKDNLVKGCLTDKTKACLVIFNKKYSLF